MLGVVGMLRLEGVDNLGFRKFRIWSSRHSMLEDVEGLQFEGNGSSGLEATQMETGPDTSAQAYVLDQETTLVIQALALQIPLSILSMNVCRNPKGKYHNL